MEVYLVFLSQSSVLVCVYRDEVHGSTGSCLDVRVLGDLLEDGRDHPARSTPAIGGKRLCERGSSAEERGRTHSA